MHTGDAHSSLLGQNLEEKGGAVYWSSGTILNMLLNMLCLCLFQMFK